MFTGLVEATAKVVSFESRAAQARLCLDLPFATELALGDSVAVNGCCLTVAELAAEGVFFDLLSQTLVVTSLGNLQKDDLVNVERALAVGDRFGGHFVQGHVDATGRINDLSTHGQDHRLEVSLPPEIRAFCIDKGSLCVDGISLTIADLKESSAAFWITPHTMAETHLHLADIGKKVNLEADLLAKYVKNLLPNA